jgi:hypothetical protein
VETDTAVGSKMGTALGTKVGTFWGTFVPLQIVVCQFVISKNE